MIYMKIINSTLEDTDTLFDIYDQATVLQKLVGKKHWMGFDREMVKTEIQEKRQWKIVIDGNIACVFVTTFSDPEIWGEKDKDPAVYIHRIATHPAYRGNSFVKKIVVWATDFAQLHQKSFIRIDTGSGNDKLNNYYIGCGFNYLGIKELTDTADLPAHYQQGSFSLFEIRL